MKRLQGVIILAVLTLSIALSYDAAPNPFVRPVQEQQLDKIQEYIKQSWHTLTRSNKDLTVAAVDPKFPLPAGQRLPIYISRKEQIEAIDGELQKQLTQEELGQLEMRQLPGEGSIKTHGLLYLPHPYVVPGGRFNEMYGWDSYFIQVGLMRDGEIELARNMVENFLYQIKHYGKILNANRTYYLTRSQPPFLTQMILMVYRHSGDKEWLRQTVPAIESYYKYWTSGPRHTSETGLSTYYDSGSGPAPEVVASERDERGRSHYDRVREYYRTHQVSDYNVTEYYDRKRDRLTERFYKGDRAMRESGFDPSNRFGPFSVDILNYNPVCLNSLLYLMESDTAEILKILDQPQERAIWTQRAEKRRQQINRLLWDEKDGLYYDRNYKSGKLRRYPFVSTFYPLWVGVATSKQANRVVGNLGRFERSGGLLTSTNESGSQWDAPFGWAPMQMIAVGGLRRHGYHDEADRISTKFLSLVFKEFREHNVIVEKYDVVNRESDISSGLKFGYSSNEIGFGWTNAAFTELFSQLPEAKRGDILETP